MKILLSIISLSLGTGLTAQNVSDEFRTDPRYYSDDIGSRLVVRPQSREGSRASDLELRIEDETFFDSKTSEFRTREIATIHGGGLSNLGLRFFVSETQSQEDFLQVLEAFQVKVAAFRRHRSEINNLDEKWMGRGEETLSESRVMGKIQTDFIDRPSVVTLNWNLKMNRLWLSLDDFINIDSTISEPLARLIEHIPQYARQRAEYQVTIREKNEWINETLSLPPDADLEPTADTTDTPTVIAEEIEIKEEPSEATPSDTDTE